MKESAKGRFFENTGNLGVPSSGTNKLTTIAEHRLIILGWSWTGLSVLGSQLIGPASTEHCALPFPQSQQSQNVPNPYLPFGQKKVSVIFSPSQSPQVHLFFSRVEFFPPA